MTNIEQALLNSILKEERELDCCQEEDVLNVYGPENYDDLKALFARMKFYLTQKEVANRGEGQIAS